MATERPKEWGWVDSGTRVKDKDGNVYVADNQHGWVVLQCKATGKKLCFESLDSIDSSFQFVDDGN